MQTIDAQALTIAQTPTIDLSNTTPMTLEEAEAGWSRVNMAAEFTQYQLMELYRRQAWKAYLDEDGEPLYSGWQECAMEKLSKGRTAVHYALKSAEIQCRLIEQGVDQFKILNLPESHLRVIAQAPEPHQGEAAQKLIEWGQQGKITEQDAEAAVLAVDRTKCYNKAEKLYTGYISANGDNPTTPDEIIQWGQEKKGLTPRLVEVLRNDIEVFANNPSANQPAKPVTGVAVTTPTATNGKAPTPQPVEDDEEITKEQAAQIAGVLNSYTPKELVAAMGYMDEEYKLQLLIHIAPIIDADMLAESVDPSTSQSLVDIFYLFGEKLEYAND